MDRPVGRVGSGHAFTGSGPKIWTRVQLCMELYTPKSHHLKAKIFCKNWLVAGCTPVESSDSLKLSTNVIFAEQY